MYYKLLAVCLLSFTSFSLVEAARGRSKSFSGFETRDERPRAPRHHESPESRLALRKKFPVEVLKAGELYQTTLGPNLYGVMVKVKGEKERGYGPDASKKSKKWLQSLNFIGSMTAFKQDQKTANALQHFASQFYEPVDLWICFITDHKFATVKDFDEVTADSSKILYFFTEHIIIMVSSATESSVPIVENIGIFRNTIYKEFYDGRKDYAINISHYPRLSMLLHSFSAAVMDHVYTKKYLFLVRPLENMKKIFLKSFPGADTYFDAVHRKVEEGKRILIETPTGRKYADYILYPNPEAAMQEKGGVHTSLGWLKAAFSNRSVVISAPLTEVADAYFKAVPFKNG
ncbi:MAG: hypothetical protein CMM87_04475 [Rickettsiales bacterium]|nr:hypothetical protein [Rickettsiales bacterium]|tara:strand:- start:20599 stop:21633 length:1035 start_codon:yes stop_codon:yes gene_type:complete